MVSKSQYRDASRWLRTTVLDNSTFVIFSIQRLGHKISWSFKIILLYFCSQIRKNWKTSLTSFVASKMKIGDWPAPKCRPMRRPFTRPIPHRRSLEHVRPVRQMQPRGWRQVAREKTAQAKRSIMTTREIRKRSINAQGWFISKEIL